MSVALKLALAPVLVAQAVATRRRAPALPEAAGPRVGELPGDGEPLRVLIAGDSSAAGVGVDHQDRALAGHFSRALHRLARRPVHWQLHAKSGLTTRQVHALLLERLRDPSRAGAVGDDVAVVVTGVNDVIDLVPPRRAVAQREALADWLLGSIGVAHVVFAPLPPVHRFALLPQPLRRVMGDDARAHDDALARWAATRRDVSHVPIALDLGPEAMAADGFHPGEPVYRACGEALAAHVAELTTKGRRWT
ncbi:MAG: SGNH/GDSL hydrolase family protein [Burkholderiales bacterium]|nr:SGNH/GDSL hydrolase family protein [Burkholderiales bacterium]